MKKIKILLCLVLMSMLLTTCRDVQQCLLPKDVIDGLPKDTLLNCDELLLRYSDRMTYQLDPMPNAQIQEAYTLSLQNDVFNGGIFHKDHEAFTISSSALSDGATYSFSGVITIRGISNVSGVSVESHLLHTEILNFPRITATSNKITFGLSTSPPYLEHYDALEVTDFVQIIISNIQIDGVEIDDIGIKNAKKSFDLYDQYDLFGMKYDLDGAYVVKNNINSIIKRHANGQPIRDALDIDAIYDLGFWEPFAFRGTLKGDGGVKSIYISRINPAVTFSVGMFSEYEQSGDLSTPGIENIKMVSPGIPSDANTAGPLIGILKRGYLKNVEIYGSNSSIITANTRIGGMIGQINATGLVKIVNVEVNNGVDITGDIIGGLVGEILSNGHEVFITSTIDGVNLFAKGNFAGGTVGRVIGNSSMKIHSENTAVHICSGSACATLFDVFGGIAGYAENVGAITGTISYSSIKGNRSIGGLVGLSNNSKITGYSKELYASGITIEGINGAVGGLVGEARNSFVKGYATGKSNTDFLDIKHSSGYAGGLVGEAHNTNVIGYASYIEFTSTPSGGPPLIKGGLVGITNNFIKINGYSHEIKVNDNDIGLIAGNHTTTVLNATSYPKPKMFAFNTTTGYTLKISTPSGITDSVGMSHIYSTMMTVMYVSSDNRMTLRGNIGGTLSGYNDYDFNSASVWDSTLGASSLPILRTTTQDIDADGTDETFFAYE